MSIQPETVSKIKDLNWSWIVSAFGVAAIGWLLSTGWLQDWNLAMFVPPLIALKAMLAGKGTQKGSLGRKKEPQPEDFETGDDDGSVV